jgi:hypothetical protein
MEREGKKVYEASCLAIDQLQSSSSSSRHSRSSDPSIVCSYRIHTTALTPSNYVSPSSSIPLYVNYTNAHTAIMHYSSAAILLLLAPATRAAAIPIQGDLPDLEDPLRAVRPDGVPDLATGLVDGLAATKRDGATALDPVVSFPNIIVGVTGGVEKEVDWVVRPVAGGGFGAPSKRSADFDPATDLLIVVDILAGETGQLGNNAAAGPATVKRDDAPGLVNVIIDDTANLATGTELKGDRILNRAKAPSLPAAIGGVLVKVEEIVTEVPVDVELAEVSISGRDEATNLVGPITNTPAKVEETATEVANNAVAGIAPTKRDADADALANSIRKLSFQQIGALVNLLKVIGGRDTATEAQRTR